MKIRDLKSILRQRGYHVRPGKGSHTVWTHPNLPMRRVVLHGVDSDDAHPYLVSRVLKGRSQARRTHIFR